MKQFFVNPPVPWQNWQASASTKNWPATVGRAVGGYGRSWRRRVPCPGGGGGGASQRGLVFIVPFPLCCAVLVFMSPGRASVLGGTFPGGTFLASDDFTKARLVTALRLYQGHVAPTCAKVETFAQVDSGGQSQDML